MNKRDFLDRLEQSLKDNRIGDIEEILSEYEEHFRFKLADGFSEEEIAARLGDPQALAKQFDSEHKSSGKTKNHKLIAGIGLGFADIFVALFFMILFCWVLVMGIATIAFASVGVCLLGNLNLYSLIPVMPYGCALLFSIALLALTVLSAVGAIYCNLYFKQLLHAYFRFRKNVLSSAAGGPVYPPLAKHPQISDKAKRRIRTIALIALTVFALSFILGFIVSALTAGSMGFWHAWNWFV